MDEQKSFGGREQGDPSSFFQWNQDLELKNITMLMKVKKLLDKKYIKIRPQTKDMVASIYLNKSFRKKLRTYVIFLYKSQVLKILGNF